MINLTSSCLAPQVRLFGRAAERFFGTLAADLAADQEAAGTVQAAVDRMLDNDCPR